MKPGDKVVCSEGLEWTVGQNRRGTGGVLLLRPGAFQWTTEKEIQQFSDPAFAGLKKTGDSWYRIESRNL